MWALLAFQQMKKIDGSTKSITKELIHQILIKT